MDKEGSPKQNNRPRGQGIDPSGVIWWQKPERRLSLKVIALVVIATFVPMEIGWATNYSFRTAKAVSGDDQGLKRYLFSSSGAGDTRSVNSPEFANIVSAHVKDYLSIISSEPGPDYYLPPGIQIRLSDKFSLSKEEMDEIIDWLKSKASAINNNCGLNSLYYLLAKNNIQAPRAEIAGLMVLMEIVNGNIRPATAKGELEISLYTLANIAGEIGRAHV